MNPLTHYNIFALNIDCGYTLERVPTIYVLDQKYPINHSFAVYRRGLICFPDVRLATSACKDSCACTWLEKVPGLP